MAILANLPGVEVVITVNGRELREYFVTEAQDGPNTTTRYIEASSNQTFAVRCKVPKDFNYKGDCLVFEVFVDGVFAATAATHVECTTLNSATGTAEGVSGGNRLRKFRFVSIETADNDCLPFNADVALVKSLGTIRVVVRHAKKIKTIKPVDHQSASTFEPLNMGTLSKKTLESRALSHSVSPEEMRQLLKKIQEEKATSIRLKREHQDDELRARKKPRAVSNSTMLELDDDGNVHETTIDTASKVLPKQVIDLD
ncbi:hypothetical protein LTR28_012044 [Elasticomyces elasticus]|nr:hypothetical protein LTR50_003776 [Elasticomyces elasticus]KAK5010051.1 hypothetical protein LTR28_012044 [Elasticomyces elasticus]